MSTVLINEEQPSKIWSYGLWALQGLMAITFGMAGFMKLTTPITQLAQNLPWVTSVSEIMVRFIGLSEFAGALGLILPSITKIKPSLTPLAGLGLALIMILASIFHITRGEFVVVPINLIFTSICLLISYGRSKKAVIESK
ncbi:MAG: DoxX family protein [Candidatus Sericytochromatia bacterium]